MNIGLFIPVLRQLLGMFGGYLVAHGFWDEVTSEAFIGFGINGFILAWWAVDRYRINKRNAEIKHVAQTQARRF